MIFPFAVSKPPNVPAPVVVTDENVPAPAFIFPAPVILPPNVIVEPEGKVIPPFAFNIPPIVAIEVPVKFVVVRPPLAFNKLVNVPVAPVNEPIIFAPVLAFNIPLKVPVVPVNAPDNVNDENVPAPALIFPAPVILPLNVNVLEEGNIVFLFNKREPPSFVVPNAKSFILSDVVICPAKFVPGKVPYALAYVPETYSGPFI